MKNSLPSRYRCEPAKRPLQHLFANSAPSGQELAEITQVAVCSGNHDNAGRQISPDRAPVYEWLSALASNPRIAPDGATRVVCDLIVTTVPYHCSKEQKSIWLDRGSTIRRQRGNRWLVFHHVPPSTYPGSTGEEAEAAELLQIYRPDYFISGHSHQFSYYLGLSDARELRTTWAQQIDRVNVLVPGQLFSAPWPNHIILDTESGEGVWHTSSETWISEDGLYDHLVLKLPKY